MQVQRFDGPQIAKTVLADLISAGQGDCALCLQVGQGLWMLLANLGCRLSSPVRKLYGSPFDKRAFHLDLGRAGLATVGVVQQQFECNFTHFVLRQHEG